MAIYHLSVKTISRSAGRSATAASAYRAAVEIADERTGEVHDFTRKKGVESAEIILPNGAPDWAKNRAELWNAAEQSEKRINSTVAREFEIALPSELSKEQRKNLAEDFARELVSAHRCAADVTVHAPNREGDERNHHAHILLSTRRITQDGFTEKTRELDDKKTGSELVKRWRERFATLQNEHLERAGIHERVDHRTLEDQGIDREPTKHLGVHAIGFERRTGKQSRRRLDLMEEANERLTQAKAQGELARQAQEVDMSIICLSTDLKMAKEEREKQNELKTIAKEGMSDFKRQFEQYQQQKEQEKALEAQRVELERKREEERKKLEQSRDRGYSR